MDHSNFQIFTSIRSDPILLQSTLNSSLSATGHAPSQFYMLLHHRDRMLYAAQAFGWTSAVWVLSGPPGLLLLEKSMHKHLEQEYGNAHYQEPLKLRVLLHPTGELATTSTSTPPVALSTLFPTTLLHPQTTSAPSATWQIFIPPHTTTPSPHTTHKTTLRTPYNAARSLLPSSSFLLAEILLSNAEGDITEGSITTPYFHRGGKWVTPPTSSGGNMGTTRRWALGRGLCVQEPVTKGSVEVGEKVWLSNGVRGWGWGKVEESFAAGQE